MFVVGPPRGGSNDQRSWPPSPGCAPLQAARSVAALPRELSTTRTFHVMLYVSSHGCLCDYHTSQSSTPRVGGTRHGCLRGPPNEGSRGNEEHRELVRADPPGWAHGSAPRKMGTALALKRLGLYAWLILALCDPRDRFMRLGHGRLSSDEFYNINSYGHPH